MPYLLISGTVQILIFWYIWKIFQVWSRMKRVSRLKSVPGGICKQAIMTPLKNN